MNFTIRKVTPEDKQTWFLMRKALWPEASDAELSAEQDAMLANEKVIVFLAFADGEPAGMVEAGLRDYGEGCDTSPVGYLEGWFVCQPFRGKGVAGLLAAAAEDWAREKGCAEMASDTWLENETSIRAHARLGYHEVERLVHFVKRLG